MHMMGRTIMRLFFNSIIILGFSDADNKYFRYEEANRLALEVYEYFYTLFDQCAYSTMPKQSSLVDDLNTFVNHPSRTTVGLGTKFTSNRKFFANLISSTAFKEMLAEDENLLKGKFIKKLRFCHEAAMDKGLLREMYDREVDQAK